MKYVTGGMLLAGLALLGVIITQADLAEVWRRLGQVGFWGFAVILAVYFVAFLLDTLSWQLTLPSARRNVAWMVKLFRIRMIGQALNNALPLASLGGEPVKAAILNRHHGIGYREATASLVLAQTINNTALALFALLGALLMFTSSSLEPDYRTGMGWGFIAFSAAILTFFLLQRLRALSRFGRWLSPRLSRPGPLRARLAAVFGWVKEVEDRLIAFYTRHQRRLAAAVTLAFCNWILGAVEIYYSLRFLGHPIAFQDAWIIESAAMLVRIALFFVPLQIGAQEGAFLLVCGAITGSPALALAVALIRRIREVTWIASGLLLGWPFLRSAAARTTPFVGERAGAD